MRLHTVLVIVLAVVFCCSAATGIIMLRNHESVEDANSRQIVVATTDIIRGQLVNESMITQRAWPVDLLPRGAHSESSAVVGRTALTSIMSGEPILNSRLADRDAGRGLAALIPNGQRAYTIHTSRVASNVAGFVMPGNRVDVLLTLRGGSNDGTGGGSSTTLLQAVEILAVDQRLDAPSDNRVDPQLLRSVTLLVTPDQASLLDLGQNMGTLTLSLRNIEDLARSETVPATVNVLRYTQRQPTDNLPKVAATPLFEGVKSLFAAAAMALPKHVPVETLRPTIDPPNPIAEIQTLRGRHSGRVLVRTGR